VHQRRIGGVITASRGCGGDSAIWSFSIAPRTVAFAAATFTDRLIPILQKELTSLDHDDTTQAARWKSAVHLRCCAASVDILRVKDVLAWLAI